MSIKYVTKILPEYSVIKYSNNYYVIDKILEKHYRIYRIEHDIPKKFKEIRDFDCEIIQLPIKKQQDIHKFEKFREKYNKTIEYLNKYKNSYNSPRYGLLSFVELLRITNLKCGISIRHLYDIMIYLKKTQDRKIEIHNIFLNPFDFIKEEKQLISYLIAEKICAELNITVSFEKKCEKWSFYHIIHTYKSFYVEVKKFYDDFKKLCDKNGKKYAEYLSIIDSVIIKKNIDKKDYVTTQYLYDYEKKLTSTFIDLYSDKHTDIYCNTIDTYIVLFEKYMTQQKDTPYSLDTEQKTAVKNALKNSLSVITGFPGTGKSSIVQCILYVLNLINKDEINEEDSIYEDDDSISEEDDIISEEANNVSQQENNVSIKKLFVNNNVSIMSPTGLAFVNLQKKCSYTENEKKIHLFNLNISGTCHKTLYNIFPKIISRIDKQLYKKQYHADDGNDICGSEEEDIPKIIIVDEFSMMDIFMFKELIDYCKKFAVHLILVGDHNQLPSIGPGCILNSIIEINKEFEIFNITNLIEIKRQDDGSLLKNIIKMTYVGLNKDDFVDESMQFIDISLFLNKNNTLIKEELETFIDTQNLDNSNCKFLSYFNGENEKSKCYPTNVLDLNKIIQSKFNPNGTQLNKRQFDTFTYKIGDIIIRIENETTENGFRANGEQAIIQDFDETNVYIKYLDSIDKVSISSDKFHNEFKLAYALTVHKSQGSQYKNIVIFVEPNSYVWDKPALYTAISRAEEKCFIIADYTEFLKIQENSKKSKKPTLFLKEIEQMYELI